MQRNVSLVVLVLALSVRTVSGEPVWRGWSPPWPAVAEVVLTETAVIEPGHARAFLQFGRWVPHGALNRFEPSCNLEVRDLSEFIQRVETDRFRVLEITQGWDMVVQGAGSHARAGWWGRRETDREINRYRRFRLHSPRQSAVMRLTCHAGDRDWREARPPAWREVLECVGDKIRFTVSAGERPA